MLILDTTVLNNDDTLHLSYGAFNYPYFYQRTTGLRTPIGFLPDVWKVLTEQLEYHQYPYEDSSFPVCDGILLPVQEGRTLTTAGAYTPTVGRTGMFRQSAVTYYTSFNFYEADRIPDEPKSSLTYLIASFLHFLIESLRNNNENAGVQRNPLVDAIRFISHIVFAIGVFLIAYYHSAGFRGNSVLFTNTVHTSFADLVGGLHDGSRLLMTKSATTLRSDSLYALVGNRTQQSDVVEADQTQLMQKLCDNPNLVAMMEVNAVYSMSILERPCQLSKISIPQPWKSLERYDTQLPQVYLMSWNHTRKRTEEAVNQVLLRIFQQDMIESFWTNRYLLSMKDKPSIKYTKKTADTFVPMSLTRLQILFYFTGPGWFLSIIVFLMELSPRVITPFMRYLQYRTMIKI
ncbi:hypothetical protein PRIPAC_95961 [Pristionchus pacificus]|uniref:Uncharacterized protein n=1 Tax=Pristionchus pacificus TaxID=54126 RepID=A0A454XMP3_PRIPA|nr:hypothetical protein PRIPAC_95961 [Pristionchus pacificus]|eukprot:PDM84211.1 hypothetical protein PRIPAC_33234 [Pristionchus pacificus]